MKTIRLGDGLRVPAMGLGCMGMSEFYGARPDPADSLRVIARACELGAAFLDTADTYGAGHNEELIGRFLRETGARPLIASKCGILRRPGEYARSIDNRPDYIRAACEASLKRLGVERIDLFYLHRLNPEHPIEDAMAALAGLKADGKIGHIGLSEAGAATLRRACAVAPVAALQSEYSLWTREIEAEIRPACDALGVGLVAYSPLGRGFLTGAFRADAAFGQDDSRAALPRFSGDNLAANQQIVAEVEALAQEKNATPAQVALAWCMAKGAVPIPGTRNLRRLDENLAAAELALSGAEIAALEAAIPRAAGARYTEEGMKGVAT